MSPKDRAPKKPDRDSPDSPIVHEYDGIIELDNQLPRWWVYTLLGAIVFAAGYWLYFHSAAQGDLASREYARWHAAEVAAEAERLKAAGEVTPELLLTLRKDPGTVEQGAGIFAENCVTCHGDGGKGMVGPNLTDDAWIHGSDPMALYKAVREGFPEKSMQPWGKALGEARTRAVVAYVISIKGTNVAGGKAPQGDKK
ncbi:MAG: c-type cytochrome [Polyangiaceae bacterium]|nr:c-type cytochrome [Polyangiaceae bacterium]